jgi:hypothetical protein
MIGTTARARSILDLHDRQQRRVCQDPDFSSGEGIPAVLRLRQFAEQFSWARAKPGATLQRR